MPSHLDLQPLRRVRSGPSHGNIPGARSCTPAALPRLGKDYLQRALFWPRYDIINASVAHFTDISNAGGRLGFWCAHAYAYNDEHETPFPHVLKGVDAAVWESLKALCVDVQVSPIVTMDEEVRESLNEYREDEEELSEWVIGKKFGVKVDRRGEIECTSELEELYNSWGTCSNLPIIWLTTPKHKELQIVYTAVSFVGVVRVYLR